MKFGPRGYRGPRWDAYVDKDKDKEEDPTKQQEQDRKEKERMMDMATTAALGGDYETAEALAEQAGYPIARKPYGAVPPEEGAGVIATPFGGGHSYITKSGKLSPADTTNPEQTAMSLLSRFAAEKGLPTPTGTMAGKLGATERLVQGTPGGEYEEKMGVAEKKGEAKEKWPRDMFDDEGGSWKVYSEDEAKEAKSKGFGWIKPKDVKDVEYKPRKMYSDTGQEWEVRSLVEESSARSQGFSPIKPVTGDKAAEAADLKTKRLNQFKTGMEAQLRMYAGKDELIDQLLSQAGKAANFEELADLAKNAYERLKKKATQDKDKDAIIHFKNFQKFYNEMMNELGGEQVTDETTATLRTAPKTRTGEDYIKGVLGGTQL